jgi:hypothetical protein
VGPRAGLDAVEERKPLAPAENQTPAVHLLAHRFTDWAYRISEMSTYIHAPSRIRTGDLTVSAPLKTLINTQDHAAL